MRLRWRGDDDSVGRRLLNHAQGIGGAIRDRVARADLRKRVCVGVRDADHLHIRAADEPCEMLAPEQPRARHQHAQRRTDGAVWPHHSV
jgi:hypothetical protein